MGQVEPVGPVRIRGRVHSRASTHSSIDTQNPLIHFRLARELRKLDHLEASLESYKQAVTLAPEMHAWRLALARARFDVLDYEGAASDVQYVLDRIPPGSPLELPAHTLVTVFHGHSQDRGRRFDPVFTPKDITPDQLKRWALMRADAWRLFVAGHYREAEPMYRKLLELNPRDPSAAHQFGLTLMQLGKCEEAPPVFGKVSDLDPTEDQYFGHRLPDGAVSRGIGKVGRGLPALSHAL